MLRRSGRAALHALTHLAPQLSALLVGTSIEPLCYTHLAVVVVVIFIIVVVVVILVVVVVVVQKLKPDMGDRYVQAWHEHHEANEFLPLLA